MSGENCPGCLILLVDESAAMDSLCQDGKASLAGNQPKRKSDAIAATLNSLIRQLSTGSSFDVALVGYHADETGQTIARSCWGGEFAGRDFVQLNELAGHPVAVEKRTRKLPDPASLTGFREEPVDFPVWYQPESSGTAPQIKAFQHCHDILTAWQSAQSGSTGTPMVLHIFAGGSSDGSPSKRISELQKLPSAPLVFQAHLCLAEHVPPTLYAASRAYVPAGPARDLFDRCSVLPTPLINFLKAAKTAVGPGARGMVYNGRMTDIVQFLALAKEHTKGWPSKTAAVAPPAAAPAPAPAVDAAPMAVDVVPAIPELEVNASPLPESIPESIAEEPADSVKVGTEKAACILFVLDRSVTDPYSGDTQSSWSRLQDHANTLLAKIGKGATGCVQTGIISYGTDSIGEVEVRQTFEGALSGKTLVADSELADGALRVDEIQQQEPDGVGGLLTITVKKKIYVELDPTTAASPVPAFEVAGTVLSEWCGQHPEACVPPIVVHLTRGQLSKDDLTNAWMKISSVSNVSGPVVCYHLVATEEPHSTVAFPIDDANLQTDQLKDLFAQSSKLLGSDNLEVSKPKLVKADSRGLVVNGKFDFLADGINEVFSRL